MLFATGGFDQGDPPSPLVFALGFRPHLQQLEETLRRIASEQGIDPNRVRVLAYAPWFLHAWPALLRQQPQ